MTRNVHPWLPSLVCTYVCVLHIQLLLFLLVDIQHTQCPRWFFVLERYVQARCGHKTIIRHTQVLVYAEQRKPAMAVVYQYEYGHEHIRVQYG